MSLKDFYAGKKVLITGHGGFKGGWLVILLRFLGAKVYGYSLLPDSKSRLYELLNVSDLLESECIADTCDVGKLKRFIEQYQPELVFHLAAQPLVIESYLDPVTTYRTNVLGTLNVLEACRATPSVKAVVNVTTDKCYENRDEGRPFKEGAPLGGYDMYSSSKACSEILSASYRNSFLQDGKPFALATARAGNVIGGGDFAKDRLVPDCIRALVKGEPVTVRNPLSTRPWQHVLEPLYGYLTLGKALYEGRTEARSAFNFGPDTSSVLTAGELADNLVSLWGSGSVIKGSAGGFHEAALLSLDNTRAREVLGVRPLLTVQEALELTVKWYRVWHEGRDSLRELSLRQTEDYLERAEGGEQ